MKYTNEKLGMVNLCHIDIKYLKQNKYINDIVTHLIHVVVNMSRFQECFNIQGIYLNIISFLGNFDHKYKIKKREVDMKEKNKKDKYIYHLSNSEIGVGCPISNFYIQNNDVVPYIRTISLLNKSCRNISLEIFTLKCSKHNKIANNILYKKEVLKFYNRYPKFFDHEHRCEKYHISEIPSLCITRCKHSDFHSDCNYCQAKYETPYTCDCNGFYKRDYTPQYTNVSCDECATLDVNNVPKNITRDRDYCKECRAGLSDMYQDIADDARDDY